MLCSAMSVPVKLAVLALRPSLPVYPQHQTFRAPAGIEMRPAACLFHQGIDAHNDRVSLGAQSFQPQLLAALERVSLLSVDDAKNILLEQVREDAEHDAVRLAKAIERSARENAEENDDTGTLQVSAPLALL